MKRLSFLGYTIEGFSRAAIQSYWRIPELGIGFDLGGHPWHLKAMKRWFISHTHLDHIAALPSYLRWCQLMKMIPPEIYLPHQMVPDVAEMLAVTSRLSETALPVKLIGVNPGDHLLLSSTLSVTVTSTKHRIPSVGYVIWQRSKKLKPELQGLSANEIRNLKKKHQNITIDHQTPIIAYLGDSSMEGLINSPAMLQAKILIAEMTFIDSTVSREKIAQQGHMHLDDFVALQDYFSNECIIVGHFSLRYHDQEIREIVQRKLPDMLGGRLHLWL